MIRGCVSASGNGFVRVCAWRPQYFGSVGFQSVDEGHASLHQVPQSQRAVSGGGEGDATARVCRHAVNGTLVTTQLVHTHPVHAPPDADGSVRATRQQVCEAHELHCCHFSCDKEIAENSAETTTAGEPAYLSAR